MKVKVSGIKAIQNDSLSSE